MNLKWYAIKSYCSNVKSNSLCYYCDVSKMSKSSEHVINTDYLLMLRQIILIGARNVCQ